MTRDAKSVDGQVPDTIAFRSFLEVENLTGKAGPIRLFENFSVKLGSGQAVIIRGRNGVGKTTLLRILAGILEPEAGNVWYQLSSGDREKLSTHAHLLGHLNALKPAMTVRQNLDFFQKFNRSNSGLSLEEAAKRLNILSLLNLPVESLSAGQTRRAAFARLLVSHRPVWILDEPTAAMDVQSSQLIERVSLVHLQAGGVIIASTHLPFLGDYPEIARDIQLEDYFPLQMLEDM